MTRELPTHIARKEDIGIHPCGHAPAVMGNWV